MDDAMELVRRRGAAAQLCVIRDGRVVVDEAVGLPGHDGARHQAAVSDAVLAALP